MNLYDAAKVVLAPTTRMLWPVEADGLHHVPLRGPVILASNHLALIDPLFIGVAVPRQVIFIAKRELFAEGNAAQRAFTRALRAIGQLSVDRRPGQDARAAMGTSLRVLEKGGCLGIFPEGTRSPDGRLYRGRTGLASLALTSGAPVVPVALSRTQAILPPGRSIPRFNRVGLRFGPAIDLEEWKGEGHRLPARRAATDAVMAAVQRLSGQAAAGRYAPSTEDR